MSAETHTSRHIPSKHDTRERLAKVPRSFFTPRLRQLLDALESTLLTAYEHSDSGQTGIHEMQNRVAYANELLQKWELEK